jgi:hypothetical protein
MARIAATAIAALAGILLAGHARAEPCDGERRAVGQRLMRAAAQKIVGGYGGGQDLRATMMQCDFSPSTRDYAITMQVQWNGVLIRQNRYVVRGDLRASSDGGRSDFAMTDANNNVQRLRFWKTMAAGAIKLGPLLKR